ncbi:ABC transporter substrate-binding protein [Morganella morganii]|nr:ABC transporter substrate-binding protein [Morganella morganii]EJG2203189.1 ABC transporter substrate-binding protein [Morganella morganii]ELN8407620.1 ABC transporter substrate-binding protein [Morganella morganii]MBT0400852.1 ABC transporter substrate-binding protein [Morganella morganii subsp. morganii]MBX9345033.1 ABC transporter substrate-binding protein [Morganella morganii]MBX9370673.1 ABC transporter substrate-binding protein [Morganella morganii]
MKLVSVAKGLTMSLAAGAVLMSSAAWAETVVDAAGRTVEVPEKVERILLGEGRMIHAVALLEGDKPLARIAGWQGDFRKLDPQSYAVYKAKFSEIDKIPLIGNTTEDSVSAEKVLTLNPDVAIFGLAGHGPGKNSELVGQLEKAGIPVVFVDFRNEPLKNTLPGMRVLGKVLHREEKAKAFEDFYQKQMKLVTDVTDKIPEDKKPTVFIDLRAGSFPDCCGTAGNGNLGNFIDLAGGKNIAKDVLPTPLGTMNLEKVIAADPDIYLVSGAKAPGSTDAGVQLGAQATEADAKASLKAITERKGINTLTAVKEGRDYAIWHNYYNSPYNVIAAQAFAKWFYPEQFKDLDPKKTMDEMYSQFLAVEPTGTYWVSGK